MWIEIVGYIGMILVAISFVFKNVRQFRWFNSVGCVVCIIYGIISKTAPTAVLNAVILTLNIISLIKIRRGE